MSTYLCTDNAQATHIIHFQTIYGNMLSVLTDTPNNIQNALDEAEKFIWVNSIENSVAGYYPFTPAEVATDDADDAAYIRMEAGFFENCMLDCVKIEPLTRKELLKYLSSHNNINTYISNKRTFYKQPRFSGNGFYYVDREELVKGPCEAVSGYGAYIGSYLFSCPFGVYDTEAEAIEALIDYLSE